MLNNYEILELIAVQWNPKLAEKFPTADHRTCRQQMRPVNDRWVPYIPAKCVDYHCPHCGIARGVMGRHNCEQDTK